MINVLRGALIVLLLLSLSARQAFARTVDDVKVKVLQDGYEITFLLLSSLHYTTHTPRESARDFFIQLSTVNFTTLSDDEVQSIRERLNLGWDVNLGIPLQEITFEGANPERPQIVLRFTEEVDIEVASGADLKSLVVHVKTKTPPVPPMSTPDAAPIKKAPIVVKSEPVPAEPLPEQVVSQDTALSEVMNDARDSLEKGDYDRAISLYTKILLTAQDPVKQQAQELLGVARERKGQYAHAKAEYTKYIQDYPEGPDTQRVRQRLAGLVTAAQAPQGPLRQAKRVKKTASQWFSQYYGSFSQFYNLDQTNFNGGDIQTNRNDLSMDVDVNTKWRSKDYDLSARFTGGHKQNFLEGDQDDYSISALSFDMKHKGQGLYAKVGRHSLTSGGVLGRFDGVHVSSQLNKIIKLNGVFGFPVDSVRQTDVHADKKFYGMSIDWGTFAERWNFNTFIINQTNNGLTDRRAIGAEARYFDPKKAFFTLLDYDIFFQAINIFMFNGHWTLPSKTTLNLILDYRKSPLLMTNNAIQGQGVEEITDLFSRFSDDELKQLAMDRSANSKSITVGFTQDINQDLQWNTDFSVSAIEGTVSSGGVEGSEEVRPDYTCSTQLVASNVFKPDNIVISGLTYTNTVTSDTYSVSLDDRYPLTQKIRLGPRIRFDYRETKGSDDVRTTIRPTLRIDYDVTRWTRFEFEGGFEWASDRASGVVLKSTEFFIALGYRIIF